MKQNFFKIIFLIVIVTLLNSCESKPKTILSVNDLNRYEDSTASFINWLIKNDTSTLFMRILNFKNPKNIEYNMVISSKFANINRPLYLLSDYIIIKDSLYFSPIDTTYIKEILESKIQNKALENNSIPYITVINKNSIRDSRVFDSYTQITTPIFISDYNLVFIEINKICEPTCGYGIECIYKRTSNGWKKVLQNETWIN